ncbi:hypothetical protein PpBr36_02279 [Pyricularia pennisetigena]|uniref:hypothetical protein n=1 Tax=Pyricularia pennisetigena TaxID=1578925 RepID=UPI00114D5CBD|nr:hypothetical protein PpBr36_02279 [Pyricularia pennisetigena]TLS30898.1 hypothetical protein PpBr36_02279 [Pyricularia pennisetigena]
MEIIRISQYPVTEGIIRCIKQLYTFNPIIFPKYVNLISILKVLADKYYLNKLKAFAHKKFSDAVDKYYNSENFLKTAKEIYEMELLVGAFARNYKELLGMENVRRFLEVIPKLGTNVLLHLYIIPLLLRDRRRKG